MLHKIKTWVLESVLAFAPALYSRRMGKRRPRSARPSTSPTARTVLVIDHDFPEPDRDAGSRAIASFVCLLQDCGHRVTFWAAAMRPSERGRAGLVEKGVQCAARPQTGRLDEWLALTGPGQVDACVLSRPLVAAMHLPTVRRHCDGVCIYYGHDIHHRRLEAMEHTARVTPRARWERLMLRRIERRLWQDADITLYPSAEEVNHVRQWLGDHQRVGVVEEFPLWTIPSTAAIGISSPLRRAGLLFVGSMGHAPNVDGLDWLICEVMPRMKLRGVTLCIVGSGMEAYVPPRADLQINILGQVDDDVLERCYASCRLVVAPLRFGGGVKGKVVEAIAHGVPVVMTTAGAQGLDGIERFLPVSDDAERFAAEMSRLLLDDALWLSSSVQARTLLAERFDHARVRQRLEKLLASRPVRT